MTYAVRTMSIVAFAILCASCAGEPVKTQGTPSKEYAATPDKVYQATIVAFQNLGLEVFRQDKEKGYVQGGRTPKFGQGSENVGVYIEKQASGGSKVSIENQKAMLGYIFAVDWTDKVFAQIGIELAKIQ